MYYNMKQWIASLIDTPAKRPLPLLSFPCTQLMGITVQELIHCSDLQAKGMALVAERVPSAAAVSLMDLSVEAEAFGSTIHYCENEVPTVVGALVEDEDTAKALVIPEIGSGRTAIYIDAIRRAQKLITDRPVFAGIIGPYSLAGRLMDVSKTMIYCFDEPDMVHMILEKSTAFLIQYCQAFKDAGANGVIMAEPLTGLLSPRMAAEFSHPYVKRIVNEMQTDDFAVFYHNCGNNVPFMINDIYQLGAFGYHFGDAISMMDVLPQAPHHVLVMGNISPSQQFKGGTPDTIMQSTKKLLETCQVYSNFLLSSGCDIPPSSSWANIEAFFAAAESVHTLSHQ